MERSHFGPTTFTQFVDGVGTLVANCTIGVYKPGTSTPIADDIYTDRTGTTKWGANPRSVTDGTGDFYLDYPQVVRIVVVSEFGTKDLGNQDVGNPYGDDNILTYGCRPIPGFDNYDALTEAFTGTMTAYDFRYVPKGVFDTTQTILLPTDLDGWCIRGCGPGGTNRLGPSQIRAHSSLSAGALDGLVGPLEWWTNGATEDTGQGSCVMWMGFDGHGFDDARNITTAIETTSKTLHGLVVHGSGMKVLDCMSVSANGRGITQTGVGRNGAAIGESHETKIDSCGARWTGQSGIHTGVGQQDGTVSGWCKTQYNGEFGIEHEDGAGWGDIDNHPSWAALGTIHVGTGAWNYRAALNYCGSVGEFMDNTGRGTHYGIRVRSGPALILGNKINTNSAGGQGDPVVGLYWHGLDGENGVIDASHNTIICQTTDDDVEIVEKHGVTEPPSVDENNYKITHTP